MAGSWHTLQKRLVAGFSGENEGYTKDLGSATVVFQWDEKKAAANLRKHGVSFREATSVFYDLLSATGDDPDHSYSEKSSVTFGLSSSGRHLIVGYTDRGDAIRIITARKATGAERNIYEEI